MIHDTDVVNGGHWNLGGYDSLWTRIDFEPILYTWVVLGILIIISFLARWCLLWSPDSLAGHAIKWSVRMVMQGVKHTCQKVPQRYVSFFSTLFLFLLVSNCLVVIPTLEEPTKDLNTTLALSVITFLFVQYEAMQQHGIMVYLNDFFKTPIPVYHVYSQWNVMSVLGVIVRVLANMLVAILTFPLELLGKVSAIISLAFRLFGNILAGSVIASGWLSFRSGSWLWQALGIITGLNLLITLFFGIFEGVVQAFVFVMLGLSGLGRALQSYDKEDQRV
jgi:F-type H+-transporting ATPase subunit a